MKERWNIITTGLFEWQFLYLHSVKQVLILFMKFLEHDYSAPTKQKALFYKDCIHVM